MPRPRRRDKQYGTPASATDHTHTHARHGDDKRGAGLAEESDGTGTNHHRTFTDNHKQTNDWVRNIFGTVTTRRIHDIALNGLISLRTRAGRQLQHFCIPLGHPRPKSASASHAGTLTSTCAAAWRLQNLLGGYLALAGGMSGRRNCRDRRTGHTYILPGYDSATTR